MDFRHTPQLPGLRGGFHLQPKTVRAREPLIRDIVPQFQILTSQALAWWAMEVELRTGRCFDPVNSSGTGIVAHMEEEEVEHA